MPSFQPLQEVTNHVSTVARISVKKILRRADDARAHALSHVISAKSQTDFYFEDLLNSFIALCQYLSNFALFQLQDRKFSPRRHFSTEKNHEARFEAAMAATQSDGRNHVKDATDCFALFLGILGDDARYHIAIFMMNTKSEGIRRVRPQEALQQRYGIVTSSSLYRDHGVLREVLKALEAKGMVEARAKVGTCVLPQSRWNLFDRQVLARK